MNRQKRIYIFLDEITEKLTAIFKRLIVTSDWMISRVIVVFGCCKPGLTLFRWLL